MTVFICAYMYELHIWLVFKTQPGVEVQLLGYTTIYTKHFDGDC